MVSEILLIAGVGVLSIALRSFRHPALFRVGTFGFVATSFLAGWLLGGSLLTGLCFASTWFLLPWLEILTRVRRLRLPIDRRLEACAPPSRAAFPAFAELSEEMESGGFEYVEDVEWRHEESRHFFRLFQCKERMTAGAICLVEQADFTFYYIVLRSRTSDGRLLVTWNYPFSYGLHQMPGTVITRAGGEKTVSEVIGLHWARVGRDAAALVPMDPEALRAEIQADLRGQFDHNVACGILRHEGDATIRYTVRGMFFLWFQFLRDFIRFT